jgi:hypothetical protein
MSAAATAKSMPGQIGATAAASTSYCFRKGAVHRNAEDGITHLQARDTLAHLLDDTGELPAR